MKTKLLTLLLIIIVFSSCNTAKQYANYRVGGKTKHETKIVQNENKIQVVNEMTESEKTMDTLMPKNIFIDTSSITNLAIVVDKKNLEESNKLNESELRESKSNKISNHQISQKNLSEKNPIQKSNHKKSFQKKYKSNDGDGIYIIGVILIIAGGIMALLAANVSLLEIITFGLGMVAVAILLYLIGEAFMNIFPGMQKKNKRNFSLKNLISKILPSRSMKYYGGMSIKGYFIVGLFVILAVGLFTLIMSTFANAMALVSILFSIHLGISAILCIGYGLVYICTGGMMSIKKKVKFKTSPMKNLDSYWTKIIFGAVILGLLVFLLSNSLGLGILTALLILLAGLVALVIVTAIILWLLVELFVLILEEI